MTHTKTYQEDGLNIVNETEVFPSLKPLTENEIEEFEREAFKTDDYAEKMMKELMEDDTEWIDPAEGIHYVYEDDLASIYE